MKLKERTGGLDMPRGRKKGSKNKTIISEVKSSAIKKEKKIKLSKAEKKANLLSSKIGNNQGGLAILDANQRYYLTQRIIIKDKKDKFRNIYSNLNLEFIQQIASHLSENLKLPYNSLPIVKQKRAKKEKENKFDIDRSMFREYRDHCLIFLDFGTIWLGKENKFSCKRNYEKIDGAKIFDLYGSGKFTGAYNRCKELLQSYTPQIKEKILKEAGRYGNFENKNSIRVAMGLNPIEVIIDDKDQKFIYKEIE